MEFSILAGYVQDFKSFRGKHTLDIEALGVGAHRVRGFNDDNARLGSNGSGKSTFLSDALSWCLYGRTAAGLRNPDVKPWRGKGKTVVRFIVRVGDRVSAITRSIKPSRLVMDSNTVGQADIDRFLGMGFEVFTHTILLAQGRPLFFDKSPRDKMALFSDVLQLDRWDARSKLASDRAREQERELDRASGAMQVFQDELRRLNVELPEAKKLVMTWSEERERIATELEKGVKTLIKQIDVKERAITKWDLMLDGAGMQIKMIREDLAAATIEYRSAFDVYNKAEAVSKGASFQVSYLKKELEKIAFGDTCPTCKQKIRAGSLTTHRKQLKVAIDKAKDRVGIADDVLQAMDIATNKRDRLEQALFKHEEDERKARDELEVRKPFLDRMVMNLTTCRVAQGLNDKKENPHKGHWLKLRRQKSELKKSIADAVASNVVLERRIQRSKLWIKGFKDMRLYLVEEVLQELTIATNAALEEVGLIGWSVEYTIEKETKAGSAQQGLFVMIKSPANDKAVRWEAWSGGEGQRLRLIGALALAEVLLSHAGIEPKIEILDEPTRHMSPEGVRDVAEYLILRSKDTGRQIFLVDHQLMGSSQFASTITIAKDRKGSYIVEG